ncbi:hypothetical protein [Nocardia sp. CA-119907]|uniref:hypothetical protein n=1 Tax=Nocardia sp. CA-119907 TaxID=3239973 RepID=UPI003D982E07
MTLVGEESELSRAEVGESVRIVERVPTVVEYRALRASVGWKVPAAAECESALAASLYSVNMPVRLPRAPASAVFEFRGSVREFDLP